MIDNKRNQLERGRTPTTGIMGLVFVMLHLLFVLHEGRHRVLATWTARSLPLTVAEFRQVGGRGHVNKSDIYDRGTQRTLPEGNGPQQYAGLYLHAGPSR